MAISYRELTPDQWPAIETLFGLKGACAGCWCMHWRIPNPRKNDPPPSDVPNREQFKALVESGAAQGILAYDGITPVGWLSFGPRADFPRIDRTKAYIHPEPEGVWSVNCFFLNRHSRGKGIARGLLRAAVKALKKRKVRAIEGYPVPLTKDGAKLPATFSFTGPLALFESEGFEVVQRTSYSRPMVRLELRGVRK